LTFTEPDFPKQETIYIVKDNNKQTEQMLDIQIRLITSSPEATQNKDFVVLFSDKMNMAHLIPGEEVANISVMLYPDDIVEGNEQFIVEASLVNESLVSSGVSVFRAVLVTIRDNDRKFN